VRLEGKVWCSARKKGRGYSFIMDIAERPKSPQANSVFAFLMIIEVSGANGHFD
jgi:hypothetical protein